MRKSELIKFYEREVLNESLPAEIRHAAAKELSVLRRWRASLSTSVHRQRVKPGVKKWGVWQQWLETRCPAELRRPSIDGGIDKGIQEWMVVYIRTQKRSKFSLSTLDEAFQKYLEQQQQPVPAKE
jgi:hypothetical protein